MKKFISFVMAAAMVASLVPATAFAKGDVTATARVVDAVEFSRSEVEAQSGVLDNLDDLPELQLRLTDIAAQGTLDDPPSFKFELTLDNAEWNGYRPGSSNDVANETLLAGLVSVLNDKGAELKGADIAADVAAVKAGLGTAGAAYFVEVTDHGVDFVEYKFTFDPFDIDEDYRIVTDLDTVLTKFSNNTKATVSVDSTAVKQDDIVFATILGTGITASVRKTVDVAVEEKTELNSRGLTIKSAVGDFTNGQKFELRLSNGFEFDKFDSSTNVTATTIDGRVATFTYSEGASPTDEIVIPGADIIIEATSAKAGAVATMTVKALRDSATPGTFSDTTTVEVATVVDYKVNLSVDEDEDLPVIYSGVNVDNDGITDDSDHLSLEVTAKESFPGAWSMRQGFTFSLPEGVHVTDVKINDFEGFMINRADVTPVQMTTAFEDAYEKGDHVTFEFAKRVFDDVDVDLNDDKATMTFQLELVADPTFEGDVVLKFDGALVDSQEVTIAKFVKPYTVTAAQNDVIIDYRNTSINTDIVVTEAEAGLWDKGARFNFTIDRGDVVQFEDSVEYVINDASDLEIKDGINERAGQVWFEVKTVSGDEPAVVTMTNLELFMQRSIPAGSYDLKISTSMEEAFLAQGLFNPDETDAQHDADGHDDNKECYVDDVDDYSSTVREAFINVVTSGRDNDNLFTTKVTVPVGEQYILAGEDRIELDAASVAYITADGYTMLPVRAVARALGINTSNVMWSGETRTVTIMYGQRIVTMTIGVKTITINGSSVPSSAAPEIKDGRTFLPLRDLATALGVTDITWDAATRTATLNGGTAATTTAATPAA